MAHICEVLLEHCQEPRASRCTFKACKLKRHYACEQPVKAPPVAGPVPELRLTSFCCLPSPELQQLTFCTAMVRTLL